MQPESMAVAAPGIVNPVDVLAAVNARYLALIDALPKRHLLYGVVDAAVDETLYERISAEPGSSELVCLYDGDPAIRYARYAPYLFKVSPNSPLSAQWLDQGWSAHWGVFLSSHLPPDQVKRHLKKLLQVRTPKGGKAWMRFYDPRVLPKLLGNMCATNVSAFFDGVVHSYFAPSPQPGALLRMTCKKAGWLDKLSDAGSFSLDVVPIRHVPLQPPSLK